MLYTSKQNWLKSPRKRIMLFGMSGLGKTYISEILRARGDWFHYSVDYRIGTRYMGEHIADNFTQEAMKNPFLAELLRTDAIYIGSNIKFSNLSPLSTYLGKPGDREKGGLHFDEYCRRQELHRNAEISAMLDSVYFIKRAKALYDYDNFICDTSGSLVEIVNADDPNDPILSELSKYCLPVWIKGSQTQTQELTKRFINAPKPMYYQPDFLHYCWGNYLKTYHLEPDMVDPNHFIIWGYQKLIENRIPRYEKIAHNWGITLAADDLINMNSAEKFITLIGNIIETTHAN